jgi:hypothetical protein
VVTNFCKTPQYQISLNPFSDSHAVTCGQVEDRQTDMATLMGAFLQLMIGNMPKTSHCKLDSVLAVNVQTDDANCQGNTVNTELHNKVLKY